MDDRIISQTMTGQQWLAMRVADGEKMGMDRGGKKIIIIINEKKF